jgi:hypothetical protein
VLASDICADQATAPGLTPLLDRTMTGRSRKAGPVPPLSKVGPQGDARVHCRIFWPFFLQTQGIMPCSYIQVHPLVSALQSQG